MNEREAEPADVRPFLPRPGEPVEDYAERLRAMHRDLSVVLQAVERGLQRAHPPEEAPEGLAPPPDLADLPPDVDEVRVASAAREPSATALREGPIAGAPRVEVVTTRSGHRADDDSVDTPWVEGELVERRAPIEVSEQREDPRWERPFPAFAERPPSDPLQAPPPQPALAERPSADPRYAEQPRADWAAAPVPAPAPPAPPAAPKPSGKNIELPPWIVTAVLAGWLTVIALLFAVVLGQ